MLASYDGNGPESHGTCLCRFANLLANDLPLASFVVLDRGK